MICDLLSLGTQECFDADLCIIGAGAAGIAIAHEFVSSPHRVLVLESGGFRREHRVQQLYRAPSIGERYYQPLDECRSRFFGGSTNCWGGICTPLDEIDFEERQWIPGSGWPLRYGDIQPLLLRAHHLCSSGPFLYDAGAWEQIGCNPRLFDPGMFRPFVWQFNSRGDLDLSFGKRFRSELRRAPNVEVLLHANVTELVTGESGRMMERARIRALDGGVHTVRARCFILACGGIENARLLLASTAVRPNGIGNERGLVGRFFHEHLQLPCGMLVASPQGNEAARYSGLHRLGRTVCLPGLGLAPAAQAVCGTPNTSLSVDPLYDRESGFMALQMLRSDFRRHCVSSETLKRFWRAARGCGDWAPEAWRRFVHWDRPQGDPRRYIIFARSEQSPNAQSRVVLSRETDELGTPLPVLDWHTTPLDRKGIRLAAAYAIQEFRRLGIGEILEAEWLAGADWPEDLAGGPHHMGTTRMADDPRGGVVDKNCKVFGVEGLYVAGSSVFPTGGHAHPTLSILALALRLADHLRASLSSSSMARSARVELRSPDLDRSPATPDLTVANQQSASGD